MLYVIHLSRHVAGTVKGPVKTMPAKGILADVNGETPCVESIGDCLPACYRRAWSRHSGNIARYSEGKAFHWTLYDTRGNYLNTVYAIPVEAA